MAVMELLSFVIFYYEERYCNGVCNLILAFSNRPTHQCSILIACTAYGNKWNRARPDIIAGRKTDATIVRACGRIIPDEIFVCLKKEQFCWRVSQCGSMPCL